MKSRVLASLLALALVLATSPVVPAQTINSAQTAVSATPQDWQGLRDLKPGKKVLVEFKGGNTLDGKLVSITGSTLTVSGDGNVYSVEQRDIQRVYRLKGRWSRKTTSRIGLAIGLVGGAIIGGRAMDRLERNPNRIPSDADEIPFIAGLGIGTFAGAGLGWLLGGRRKSKLLYEAK
jgi:small nuclear ribonucleoprotein (snRNP)-like protein